MARAMYKPVTDITVRCWGKDVGRIGLDPRSGYYAFEYYPAFQKSNIELAPLSLPLNQTGPRVFPNLAVDTYYRLPAFISDSIPDNFGNSLINSWMAQQGILPSHITALDRLAYAGRRSMGALEFAPATTKQSSSARPSALDMNLLVEAARKSLVIDLSRDEDLNTYPELAQLIQVGTSAGGARAKAVVGYNPTTKTFVAGQLEIPEGYGHWIIKLDVGSDTGRFESQEFGRIEYAYHLMAKECGIDMTESVLCEVAGHAHFMTRRFDREDDGTRHHIQTLCAMGQLDFNALGVHDYSQLFMTAASLGLPPKSDDEIFRRMVFNVATSNNDDHTKNHSFILKQGDSWQLAPAYDVTHAHGTGPDAWTAQHSMGVNGKFTDIKRADLLDLGQRFSVRAPKRIIDGIIDVVTNWPDFAEQAGLSQPEQERVWADISRCCAGLG